jgi:hypothetical protein
VSNSLTYGELNIHLLKRVAPSWLANDRKTSKELDLSDFPVLHFFYYQAAAHKKSFANTE